MVKSGWHLLIALILLATAVAAGHQLPGLAGSFVDVDIRNSLHIVGFAAVAAIVFELVPTSVLWKSANALVFTLSLGFMAEIAQQYYGS